MRPLLSFIFILLFAFGCGKKATNTPVQLEQTPETPNADPNGKPSPQTPSTPAGQPTPTGNAYTNDFGMKFVRVPKGMLWSPGGKQTIPDDFYIGVYEVTQEEWQKVMKRNPSNFSEFSHAAIYQPEVKDLPKGDFKRFPVEKVSWREAGEFTSELNSRHKIEGWEYRLPTRIQWEYAARGAEQDEKKAQPNYHFKSGPTNTLTVQQANFGNREVFDQQSNLPGCLKRTCKVGSYEPNERGIYDMHGNVWEWCIDPYPGTKYARVRCGGAYSTGVSECSAGHLGHGAADDPRVGNLSSSDTGLRLVIVPVKPVILPPPGTKPEKPPEPEVLKYTATNFMNLLKTDTQAANRLRLSRFQIDGTIAKLDEKLKIVTLKGTETTNVACFFSGTKTNFTQFQVGQKVTVKGTFDGINSGGHAHITKCEVVK